MARTAQQYVDLMRHVLGKRPDSRHDLWATLNDAGRRLHICAQQKPWHHSWTWAARTAKPLTIKAGQAEIPMMTVGGVEFSALKDLSFSTPNIGRVVFTVPEELADLRQRNLNSPGTWWVSWKTAGDQGPRTKSIRNVIAIWPIPSADLNMLATIQQDWRELEEARPNDVPAIPLLWERLLYLICRDMAWSLQNSTQSIEAAQIPDEINVLVNHDTGNQPKVGQARHSVRAAASRRGQFQYPHSRITR